MNKYKACSSIVAALALGFVGGKYFYAPKIAGDSKSSCPPAGSIEVRILAYSPVQQQEMPWDTASIPRTTENLKPLPTEGIDASSIGFKFTAREGQSLNDNPDSFRYFEGREYHFEIRRCYQPQEVNLGRGSSSCLTKSPHRNPLQEALCLSQRINADPRALKVKPCQDLEIREYDAHNLSVQATTFIRVLDERVEYFQMDDRRNNTSVIMERNHNGDLEYSPPGMRKEDALKLLGLQFTLFQDFRLRYRLKGRIKDYVPRMRLKYAVNAP